MYALYTVSADKKTHSTFLEKSNQFASLYFSVLVIHIVPMGLSITCPNAHICFGLSLPAYPSKNEVYNCNRFISKELKPLYEVISSYNS